MGIKARFQLRYDTYTNWFSEEGKKIVLLKGEAGVCIISEAETSVAQLASGVYIKIGDGETSFEQLPWSNNSIQADWNQTEVLMPDYIKNKPLVGELFNANIIDGVLRLTQSPGMCGKGIRSIQKINENLNQDNRREITYQITFTDDTSEHFIVTDGKDGKNAFIQLTDDGEGNVTLESHNGTVGLTDDGKGNVNLEVK